MLKSARPQPADFKRRLPRQHRARVTVEAIVEATAQILRSDGRAGLNTNRIAERAGVSIGTPYQYFPNKQAILVEIARREIDRDRTAVLDSIVEASKDAHIDPARLGIRSLIADQADQSPPRCF